MYEKKGLIPYAIKSLYDSSLVAPKQFHYRNAADVFAQFFPETTEIVDGRNVHPTGMTDTKLYAFIVTIISILDYAKSGDPKQLRRNNPFSPVVDKQFDDTIRELGRIGRSQASQTSKDSYEKFITYLTEARTTIAEKLDAEPHFKMFDSQRNVSSYLHQICPDLPFGSVKARWPDDKEKALNFIVSNFKNNYDKVMNGQVPESDTSFNLYPTVEETMDLVDATFNPTSNFIKPDTSNNLSEEQVSTRRQPKRNLETAFEIQEEQEKGTPASSKKRKSSSRSAPKTTPKSIDPPPPTKKNSPKPKSPSPRTRRTQPVEKDTPLALLVPPAKYNKKK